MGTTTKAACSAVTRCCQLAVGIMLLRPAPAAWSCEITMRTKEPQKEAYAAAEEIILVIEVYLTHKDCPEGIEATKYQAEGLKVLGLTPWREVSPGRFTRMVKASITTAAEGKGAFHARRKCDKEGGYGVLRLVVPATGS